MPGQPPTDRPSERLEPGARCTISEGEWFDVLESRTLLHQWGPAFLVDEGAAGDVRLYLRDDEHGRHLCLRLDAAASARARAGVEQVEAAARQAADVITANQAKASQSPADLAAERAVSLAYTASAEALYRELMGGA